MAKRRTKGGVKAETSSEVRTKSSTAVAAKVSGSIGRTRKGRDRLTRVTSPIKVTDTNARQWNRYTP